VIRHSLGRNGLLREWLRRAVELYERTLVELPQEARALAQLCPITAWPDLWWVVQTLWNRWGGAQRPTSHRWSCGVRSGHRNGHGNSGNGWNRLSLPGRHNPLTCNDASQGTTRQHRKAPLVGVRIPPPRHTTKGRPSGRSFVVPPVRTIREERRRKAERRVPPPRHTTKGRPSGRSFVVPPVRTIREERRRKAERRVPPPRMSLLTGLGVSERQRNESRCDSSRCRSSADVAQLVYSAGSRSLRTRTTRP